MPSNSSVMNAVKTCCACGADVNGQPRMKDSQGRYWCVPCGEADQRKKAITATHLACVGCRKPFPKGKLNKHGEHFFCKPCLKRRTAAESRAGAQAAATPAAVASDSHKGSPAAAVAASAGGPANADRRRTLILAALLVVLVLFSLLYNFVLLD